MTTYQPGNYKISVTVTMPAETARQLGAPEQAQFNGATATRTFGPVDTWVEKKATGKQLAARFVASCMAEHRKAKYRISSFNITPDAS